VFTDLRGLDNFVPIGTNTTQYQISDDFVKTWGAHKVGFGASPGDTPVLCGPGSLW